MEVRQNLGGVKEMTENTLQTYKSAFVSPSKAYPHASTNSLLERTIVQRL